MRSSEDIVFETVIADEKLCRRLLTRLQNAAIIPEADLEELTHAECRQVARAVMEQLRALKDQERGGIGDGFKKH